MEWPMSRNQDRSSAPRDGTRLAGMFFCSGSAIGCKRVAQLDPRFVVLSKYRRWMIFRAGSREVSCTRPEFGESPTARRKTLKKELALFHTILIWDITHIGTVDIEPGKVKQLGG